MEDHIEFELKHIALHEAGHAVAYIRLDVGCLLDATIARTDDYIGRVQFGEDPVYDEASAQEFVLACCAGYAALVAAGYDDDTARVRTWNDFEKAQHLIDYWELPGTLEDWLAKTVVMMREPRNVRAVRKIADELLARRTIDSDLLNVLVNVADGECTQQQYAEYLSFRELV